MKSVTVSIGPWVKEKRSVYFSRGFATMATVKHSRISNWVHTKLMSIPGGFQVWHDEGKMFGRISISCRSGSKRINPHQPAA
jgi:hypothetical protein